MTINELEQGVRNLIAAQPNIISSPGGDVINSVLGMIYSFREFAFKVQSHPYQDSLKFNMMNETQKLENAFVISVCQIMQERGINIMLYVPQTQYGPVPMGPAGFGPGMVPNGAYGPVPQGFGQPAGFGQAPQGYGVPVENQTAPVSKKTAPNFQKATVAVPETNTEELINNLKNNNTEPKFEPKVKAAEINTNGNEAEQTETKAPKKSSTKKEQVDALLGEYGDDEPTGKAAGRDYLLQLLKK